MIADRTRGLVRVALVIVVVGSAVLSCATATRQMVSDTSALSGAEGWSESAAGAFPDDTNTGVPAGTQLADYGGPCTIDNEGETIDSKLIRCEAVEIRAANVTIKNSKVLGHVVLDTDYPDSRAWSYTLQDSEVDAGTVRLPAVSYGNMTVLRSDIRGGATSVQCGEHALFCVVRDSWLHGQNIPSDADWHLGGFLSNGGTNVELTHNTIACEPKPTRVDGGCTGDVNLLGDFAPVSQVSVIGNLLKANTGNAYCTYGGDADGKPFPHADRVVYRDNVFERGINGKCADYGPVSSFNVNGPGNEWVNNRWDGGGLVSPAD